MSDMMQRPPMPQPGAKPGMAPNAITKNLSVLNGADNTFMGQSGMINKNMTVKDWIENVLKVPMNAPVTALISALKGQVQNRNMSGKARSMGQQAPPQSAAPTQPAPAPQGGGGLEGLMSKMRG